VQWRKIERVNGKMTLKMIAASHILNKFIFQNDREMAICYPIPTIHIVHFGLRDGRFASKPALSGHGGGSRGR